jgi:hypothetical protein
MKTENTHEGQSVSHTQVATVADKQAYVAPHALFHMPTQAQPHKRGTYTMMNHISHNNSPMNKQTHNAQTCKQAGYAMYDCTKYYDV